MKTTYSTFEICEVLELPYERFRQWQRKGDVTSMVEAQGQGSRAALSRQDAYRIEQYRRLVELGYKRSVAAQFINELKDEDLEKNNYVVYSIEIVDSNAKIFPKFFINKKSTFEFLDSYKWKEVHLINLGNLKNSIDSALAEKS